LAGYQAHADELWTASALLPPDDVIQSQGQQGQQGQKNLEPDDRPRLGAPSWTVEDAIGERAADAHQDYMNRFGLWVNKPDPRSQSFLHFFADGGFLMVHSYIANNLAFIEHGPAVKTIPKSNFNYDVNFAPRITLGGVADNGFGIRGTWWQLDDATQTPVFHSTDAMLKTTVSSVPVPGLPGFIAPGPVAQKTKIFNDQVEFDNHLHLTVADLEGFKDFSGERWSVLLGGGARYLYLSQDYTGFRVNTGKAKAGKTKLSLLADTDYLTTGRAFAGAGLTGFVEVRRRILPGFSLYAGARGSSLFGDTGTDSFQQTAEELKTTPPKGKSTITSMVTNTQTSVGGHQTLDMGDFEGGMDINFLWGRSVLFMRAGVADQTLLNAGSATSTHGNISFFGLRFSAGFNY
jgi:hypothetical protein